MEILFDATQEALVMSLDEKDQRTHIKTLQSLQRSINLYKQAAEQNPSLEKIIDKLRNSQDKLYSALAYHGVTAEQVHQIIMENSDKQLINEIMRLQSNKDKINKQLANSDLTPEKRRKLETALTRTTQAHKDKWSEIINSPDKNNLMTKLEQAQLKQLQKQRTRERDREPTRTR
ncbi:MAG: hypothetical protein LBH62_06825 [Nitrososphaerota archaeon]|nr:hypothetical protein [Nitrososphaerota archaeon]